MQVAKYFFLKKIEIECKLYTFWICSNG